MPVRLLCIHGFCQSASTFKGRTAAIRRKLQQVATLDYAQAPHELLPGDHVFVDNDPTVGPRYTWWRVTANDQGYRGNAEYTGLHESIESIRQLFVLNGPYDGLLGFSQGGSFVALLLHLKHRQKLNALGPTPASALASECFPPLDPSLLSLDLSWLDSVRFAILVAAFIPRAPSIRHSFKAYQQCDNTNAMPLSTLHVMGESDQNITRAVSEEVLACYQHPVPYYHSGGHLVPSDATAREMYSQFLLRHSNIPQLPAS